MHQINNAGILVDNAEILGDNAGILGDDAGIAYLLGTGRLWVRGLAMVSLVHNCSTLYIDSRSTRPCASILGVLGLEARPRWFYARPKPRHS